MDADKDGSITEAEFLKALKESNRDPEDYDLQAFFTKADKNKDGKISFNEFLNACHDLGLSMDQSFGKPSNKSEKDIDAIFKSFDLDGNGYITENELSHVMAKQGDPLTPEEIKDMIKAADLNGDNKIDREEFARIV
ncbi:calmodulin-like 3 [Entomortierella lignicola]|nr:calmodulin-like 3 [Entomortierella lignicola]